MTKRRNLTRAEMRKGFVAWKQFWRLTRAGRDSATIARLDGVERVVSWSELEKEAWLPSK